MTNSANGFQKEVHLKGQKLATVTSFKYLWIIIPGETSKMQILSRIAEATAALTKLKTIWRDKYISLRLTVKLQRALVISIFLYACESCYLTAELEKKNVGLWDGWEAIESLLNITFKDNASNEDARKTIQAVTGKYDDLLTLIKNRKLKWFGHISRSSG